MTEHTDKPTQKAGSTPPRKRAAKARAPEAKRAKPPGSRSAAGSADVLPPADAAEASSRRGLAPDPATVVFGSNRPIAAPPPKLPEGSGLRFAGPSNGLLKASGPQPNSPKASGLTFTAAKPVGGSPAQSAPGKPAATARPPVAKKPDTRKPEPGRADTEDVDVRKAPLTKPAIAPQVVGPRFGRERSTGGFLLVMLLLTALGGGLAFWMKLDNERTTAQLAPAADALGGDVVAGDAAGDNAAPDEAALAERQSTAATAPAFGGREPAVNDGLSPAELGEIQQLLSHLDLNPGRTDGVLTAATAAAIRNYQEMAGLPADGEANRALLEELRSVAALYGS